MIKLKKLFFQTVALIQIGVVDNGPGTREGATSVDWEALLAFAAYHAIQPQVQPILKTLPGAAEKHLTQSSPVLNRFSMWGIWYNNT